MSVLNQIFSRGTFQLGDCKFGRCVVDPWDHQEPQAHPPAPCRTIEITPEIRAADEAQRRAREAQTQAKIMRRA